MQATVTVYFNTGFNGVDIPATPSVLANAQNKVYPDYYYIREDLDKPVIRIKDTYENLCNVDYVKITTSNATSYFFAVPSAISKGVTALALDLDALLTMGGASALNYSSGWQERGHIAKVDDIPFKNIASEPWTPSNPLEAKNLTMIDSSKQHSETPAEDTDHVIITTNIQMVTIGQDQGLGDGTLTQEVLEGIVSGDTDPKMYWPYIKTPSEDNSTQFITFDGTAGETVNYKNYKVPGTSAYDAKNANVRNGIEKLFSAGQIQLQSSYIIPWEYIDDDRTFLTGGWYARLCGYHQKTAMNQLPFIYQGEDSYTIKNKKCLETYRSYVLVNLGSGDMSIKSPHEIYRHSDPQTAPSIVIWVDPSSTGKPYARFSYIKDNPLQWSDAVKGLQWNNAQLSLEGASGSMWNSINAAFQSQTLQRSQQEADLQNRYAAINWGIGANESSGQFASQKLSFDIQRKMLMTSTAGESVGGVVSGAMGGFGKGGWGGALAGTITGGASAPGNLVNLSNEIDRLNLEQANAERSRQNQIASEQAAFDEMGQAAALQRSKIDQAINENQIGLYKNNTIVAPTLMFTPEQNLGLYGYNRFAIYEIRKSDADLKSEDMFYQRFGYSGLHRPLTASCFNERQYYSYVQAFNVNIKANFGLRIRQKAIAQLNSGVRVWKVLPDSSYYALN